MMHTPAPWFPVEFAGIWLIQDEDAYTGYNLFDAEDMESENIAKANAELAAKAPDLFIHLCRLVKDIDSLLGENPDFEWQQAGYFESAKELINKLS